MRYTASEKLEIIRTVDGSNWRRICRIVNAGLLTKEWSPVSRKP